MFFMGNKGVHMKKFITIVFILMFFMIITGCSQDRISPNEIFDTYVNHWNAEEFDKMYAMLSAESTETYPTEEFVDRYQKIYNDLGISDLNITYGELNKEEVKKAFDKGSTTIPLKVNMESMAGPIEFTYDATLVLNEDKDQSSWDVDWDPGYIFPEIKDGGKISIRTDLPVRGEILDRNKMPLAMNDIVYEIGIVPANLGDDADQEKQSIANLLNISVESIDEELDAEWVEPELFVPIKKVPKSEKSLLSEVEQFDSITKQEASGRIYPSGEAAAHLIGYVGKITSEELEADKSGSYHPSEFIGKRGLEQLLEDQLKGDSGAEIVIVYDDESEALLAEKPVKDGETVTLTIDANIQDKVFNAYEGEAGTASAIDPKTGEALALVSSPSFDPNELLYGMTQSKWTQLQDDPKAPLLNRFSATFAPGSVIKPVTAAIGLENGNLKPDEGLQINGPTWSNGNGWGDYKVRRVSQTDYPVDLLDAMKRSDNIYFAMQAIRMGSDAYLEGLKNFGFGEDIPFTYPITNSTISSSGTLEGEVQLANTSYGQAEIEMSALHLATTYTAFLNDGNMIKPTLLMSDKTEEIWHENVMTKDQAQLMQDILRDVVATGTAKVANHDELAISGKTGTAELKHSSDQKGHENGWFIGYPTNEKDIIIAMMIEKTESLGASGFVAEKVSEILLDINK